MWVSWFRLSSAAPHRLPSVRKPVPQSRINCVPSGAINSRHGVLPPYRQVAGSTVGVEPRTPQKLSLAIGEVIFIGERVEPNHPEKHRLLLPTISDDGSHYQQRQRNHRWSVSNYPIT